ncbi:uncharacterized protein Dana_GF18259 [Drosophila ananassae]|uniref:Uncharacterized protein n=1 Tax=Drosophila ananassae TaxID=7217 RepID=B3LZ68_DROAN|nr:UDP-glycosyltransferase UGT5 [Drosophila ananassae]EDV42995.2 uncharacterized protein Dana_GF18259 [Drosophila ananassae]
MFPPGRWLLFWPTAMSLICWLEAARILFIAPYESYSQCALMSPYIHGLVDRGHELTVILAYKECMTIGNVTSIRIMDNHNIISDFEDIFLDSVVGSPGGKWAEMHTMANVMVKAGLNVLLNPGVQALIKTNVTFDLLILEAGYTDLLYGLAAHFNASLVGISTCGADWNINRLKDHGVSVVEEPIMPLVTPASGSIWDRLYTWYISTEEWLLFEMIFLPKLKMVHDYFFGHLDQSFLEIRHSFSLILLNQHFSMFRARPNAPGIIEVGGLHIPKVVPKLSKDLQVFIDEAEYGVIYFSLGVELKCKDLPTETLEMFVETFKSLPQRVIWKFEDEPFENLTQNIYMANFLPQQTILAHPNVKMFICHGGMLSVIEAVYYGKPLLGFPIYYDQFRNFEVLVDDGMALLMNINSFSGEDLKKSIDSLINNPTFSENALALSQRFRDRPMHPLEQTIYWTEYVLRYKGAKHMRVPHSNIKFAEYYSLDKFLLLGLRFFVTIFSVYFALSKWRCYLRYLVKFAKRFLPCFR